MKASRAGDAHLRDREHARKCLQQASFRRDLRLQSQLLTVHHRPRHQRAVTALVLEEPEHVAECVARHALVLRVNVLVRIDQ